MQVRSILGSLLVVHQQLRPLDLPLGERKKLHEIHQLMLDDPNYQNISPEEEAAMKAAVSASRELKKLGARTTNKSAAMDYRSVLEELNQMVSLQFLFRLYRFIYCLPNPLDFRTFLSHRCSGSRVRESFQP